MTKIGSTTFIPPSLKPLPTLGESQTGFLGRSSPELLVISDRRSAATLPETINAIVNAVSLAESTKDLTKLIKNILAGANKSRPLNRTRENHDKLIVGTVAQVLADNIASKKLNDGDNQLLSKFIAIATALKNDKKLIEPFLRSFVLTISEASKQNPQFNGDKLLHSLSIALPDSLVDLFGQIRSEQQDQDGARHTVDKSFS